MEKICICLKACQQNGRRRVTVTKLNGILTPFGKINLSFKVNKTGDTAKLHLQFLDDAPLPENIIIYKKSWANNNKVQRVKPTKNIDVNVSFK